MWPDSFNAFATPLSLELRPSRREAALVLSLYGLCALALALVLWPSPWIWVTTFALFAAVPFVLRRRVGGAHARALQRLELLPDGRWRWWRRDGEQGEGWLRGSAFVTPGFVSLPMGGLSGRRRVVIWRDAAPPDGFRRLRVRLRLDQEPG